MRIGFVYNNIIEPTKGGVQRATFNLADFFESINIKTDFITLANTTHTNDSRHVFVPDFENIFSENNIQFVNSFLQQNNIDIIINQAGHSKKVTVFLEKLKILRPKIRIISVIHCSLLSPTRNLYETHINKVKNKALRVVLSVLKIDSVRELNAYLFKLFKLKQYKSLLNLSSSIVTLTDSSKKELIYILGKEFHNKLSIIPNPIQLLERENDISDKNQVLFVGNINTSIKRVDLLIKVWEKVSKKNKEWQLKILGEGKALNELRSYIKDNGLINVEFVGKQNPSAYYLNSSIICSTSTTEGLSMVLLEARAYGIIPIAFDSYLGVRDVINNGVDGLLVPAFDIEKFADELLSLMNDKSRIYRLSKNSLISSKKYDISNVGQMWMTIIENLNN